MLLCTDNDVILLQETWLASDELCYLKGIHENFYAEGILTMSNDQGILVGRPHGGLGILWNKSLGDSISIVKYEQDSCRIMGLKCANNAQQLLILNIYIRFDDGCHGDNYECFCCCLILVYYTLLSKIMTPLVHSLFCDWNANINDKNLFGNELVSFFQNMITLYQTLSFWVKICYILLLVILTLPLVASLFIHCTSSWMYT